jgi:hypothetical protein
VSNVAKRGFLITFSVTGDQAVATDRIRNWAEDLLGDIRRNLWGDVDHPDTAIDKVWVSASSPRTMGDLAGAVKRTLRRHRLLDVAVVTKLSDPG